MDWVRSGGHLGVRHGLEPVESIDGERLEAVVGSVEGVANGNGKVYIDRTSDDDVAYVEYAERICLRK